MTSPLLSVEEARNRILDHFTTLDAVRVPVEEAVGRVLAENIIARSNFPIFTNSAVDGFAVKHTDIANANRQQPAPLKVVADIPAGLPSELTLYPGQAARIMTGAAVPLGADAVVPVEDTNFNYREPGIGAPERVQIFSAVTRNGNIRFAGEDVRIGDAVMHSGKVLYPQDIGFLCMLGFSEVPVRIKPRLSIFSTGDELLPVGEPLALGKIFDSNSYMLKAQIERCGGSPLQLGIVPDKVDRVKACLEIAVEQKVDIILSSAGVSVGAFDFVRSVVEENGELDFWRVNMRPGKPLAFGHYKGIPFFGLPGNPVSAFIGFEIFVRPAIRMMLGILDQEWKSDHAFLLEDIHSDGRESYLRAIVSIQQGRKIARLTGHQGSGNLRSLVEANALLVIPSGVKSLSTGIEVEFIWIGDLQGN